MSKDPKELIKIFLASLTVVHQWPMREHLQLLLEIDPKYFKKCMKIMDIRYFTLKIINEHIKEYPQLHKFIMMSVETKTLLKIQNHPCLLQKNHYSLLEKICLQLQGDIALEIGLKYLNTLPHPEKLYGFLLNSLNPNNSQITSTLEALMFLMIKKNIQVESFYDRVYHLLPILIQNEASFDLIQTMLNSTKISHLHLRNYYKLLCTLSLLNPPKIQSKIAVILCNLMRQNKPALWDLIHDESVHLNGEYSPNSDNTRQCFELKALSKHYHTDISGLFESFSQDWMDMNHPSSKKRAFWDLEDVDGIDYNCLDFSKMIKKEKIKIEMIPPQYKEIEGRTMKQAPKLYTNEQLEMLKGV
eukprot:NODE_335_length_9311_cov_0.760313.p4 type:complete len:358 gc:universal NODE_335_length_9311_cov_0.760313:4358-3285(-)